MYSGKKGLRCRVCTGCGLCPGVTPEGSAAGKIHVLTENACIGQSREKGAITGGAEGRDLVAVADLGTTTIAMLLYDEDGLVKDRYVAVNPQITYGADVISRIRAAENREKAEELCRLVRGVVEQLLNRFNKQLKKG